MEYLTEPVVYLDITDFDENGNLVSIDTNDKPVFLMIQAVFCFHCTRAKPFFQEFANKHKDKVICATIQGDSDYKPAKDLGKLMKKISPKFLGFPSYQVYYKGKVIEYEKGRKTEDLEAFLFNLLKN